MEELTPEQEKIRKKLIEEEKAMRAKQPTPWTKTKYRKYANYMTRKLEYYKKSGGKKEMTREDLNKIKLKTRRDCDWLE